jgi:hypothetical protein
VEFEASWVALDPEGLTPKERRAFVAYGAEFARASVGRDEPMEPHVSSRASEPRLRAAQLVLRDLARKGWRVRVRDGLVEIAKPTRENEVAGEKDRIRAELNVERDDQLRNPAVRTFVRSMEVRRIHAGRSVSVFSLMRDGQDLARRLDDCVRLSDAEVRRRAVRAAVSPYLQVVTDDALCDRTGLRLLDIWRYFRHTWASPYRSIPGRTMMLLVRDAAVEPHPVIGIAALGSTAVQIGVRDQWIGWQPEDLVEELEANPTQPAAEWLEGIITSALSELYVDDFLVDRTITRAQISNPRGGTIAALETVSREERAIHRQYAASSEFHRGTDGADTSRKRWLAAARTPLFRSKRAELLATLLRARMALRPRGSKRLSAEGLAALLDDPEGRRCARSLIRKAKSERVGIALAEIIVCGAVAPYNSLLGGKLVSMLLASPEVVLAYRERYASTCSVIASSTAGRPIIRPSELVLLGTSSLYGVGSSQYNRLHMDCSAVGGRSGEQIRYHELGRTAGWGTVQFGPETIKALATLLAQAEHGQRVTSIFGEGASPRLRKIREGLDALDLPSEVLLNHGNPRVVYGVPLARNFREFLLGRDASPDYLLPQDEPKLRTRQIAEWWSDRWLCGRIGRPGVLEAVRNQRLVHPIRHGARVVLPALDADQLELWSG